ncbi:hypothetical protein [Peribacillus simplex]|uniref:hypothetical protein n=1 Tax=Peribacillus simplex TaxID=1478 RepID=UPI0036D856A6
MEIYQRKMNHNRDEYRKLRWQQHRLQVTGLFDAVFSKKAFADKVAIVGAGNCDDLDLEYLATRCNSIYLFDIDMESMENGTAKLPERTRKKIQLVEIDVTGLDKVDFEHDLSSMLDRGETAKGITQYLKETENRLGKLSESVFANYYNGFDIVATSAIYTQLFYNWAKELFSDYEHQYQKEGAEEIKNGILDLRDEIVRKMNHSISKCTKQNGFCITWTDILKIEPEYMDTINEGMNAIFALASNVGYGAALIGVKTFIENVDKSELSLRYWTWDFNANKQYLTIGILGKLNGL